MLNNLDSLADADPQVLLAARSLAIQKVQSQAHPLPELNSKTAGPRLLTRNRHYQETGTDLVGHALPDQRDS
jgi:hypothetical protein